MRRLSFAAIDVIPEKRTELIKILNSIRGPTQALNDCLDCRIWVEDSDEGKILLLEQWQSWEAFMRHIRSDIYSRMLEAMELSREEPGVSFFEVTALRGMDFLQAVRNRKP